jgi:hypothetical protein
MKKLDWGHPLMMGSPLTMGLSYQMAAMKLLAEVNMKKYMPIQYQMMKAMREVMEKGR